MSTRVSTICRPLAIALLALIALPSAPVCAKESAPIARFHNALGSRVRLSKLSQLQAAWRAAKEPALVGPGSRAFRRAFLPAFKRLAPKNVEPFYIGGSGSEVNNAVLHELASQTIQRRATGKEAVGAPDPRRARTLVLEGAFVARNGPLSEIGFQRAQRASARRDVLPSILHQKLEDRPLGRDEYRALGSLERRLKRDKSVGVVLLEPIPSAHGVLFYRPAFLRAVRKLCDAHDVPLVFDEVYTAGGVSGTFFAYEHYGVEPDFVTFGKGLIPGGAGVAKVSRQGKKPAASPAGLMGFKVDPVMLHKAALVLKRIRRGRLIEKADAKGHLLLEGLARLQASGAKLERGSDGRLDGGDVRGIGLLIHGGKVKGPDGKPLSRLQPTLDSSNRELRRFLRHIGAP